MATFDDDHPLESLLNHISVEVGPTPIPGHYPVSVALLPPHQQSTRQQPGSAITSLISNFRLPLPGAPAGRNNADEDEDDEDDEDYIFNDDDDEEDYDGYGYDCDDDSYGYEDEEYDSDLIGSDDTDIEGLFRILHGGAQDSDSSSSRNSNTTTNIDHFSNNIEADTLSEDSDSTSYSPTSSLAEIYINTLLGDYSHTGPPPTPSPTRPSNRLPEADQRPTLQTTMPQTRRSSVISAAATAAATAAASSSAGSSSAQRRPRPPFETIVSDDEDADADADVGASTSSTSTSTATPLFAPTWAFPLIEEPSLFPQQPESSNSASSIHAADSARSPNPRSSRKRRRDSGEATTSGSASGSASASASAGTRADAANPPWPHTRPLSFPSPIPYIMDDGEVETINLTDIDSSQSIRDKMKADAEKKEREKRPEPPRVETIKLSAFQCVICMDDVTNLTVTHCGHLFCGECLHSSLHINVSKTICPICRQKIETRGRPGSKSTRSYFALELKLVPRKKGKEPVRP